MAVVLWEECHDCEKEPHSSCSGLYFNVEGRTDGQKAEAQPREVVLPAESGKDAAV